MFISNKKVKPIDFDWDDNGVVTKLQVVQQTVADRLKMGEMHNETIKKEELTAEAQGSEFLTARVMCGIKDLDGNYFFTGSLSEVQNELSSDVMFELSDLVMKLNPVKESDINAAKK